LENCKGLIEGNSTLIIFIKFEYNVGADDEVMDVVEEGCCENNDIVDAVEDKYRSQIIEAEGNFVVDEDGVVIEDIMSVEKCDVIVEGKKSLIINIIKYVLI